MIEINRHVSIREDEITFTYARSPGPGGQNVNKVATKVTLWFDVMRSAALSAAQRARIRQALRTRINRDGVLRVVSGRHRTQAANRREVLRRFSDLLAEALRPKPVRKQTRPNRAARERRLAEKRRRSLQKQQRRRPSSGPEIA
ncbi:MAG: alternative ribosome rescue aminoacyl-tRNA hydrolase ArfB [Phycisphaerae bacterium]